MTLDDQADLAENKGVPSEIKLQALAEILPDVASNSRFIVSGSLAAKISEKLKDGEYQIESRDLAKVNDVDIATTLWEIGDLQEKARTITENTGVDIEVSPILQSCIYPDSPVHELAVSKAKLELPNGKSYNVSYTTPEFLLLSLVDQSVGIKTPPDKYRAKVMSITHLSSFSLSKFKQLVNHELTVRHYMNRDTFRLWKQQVLNDVRSEGTGFGDHLTWEYSKVSSLIDQSQLFNIARNRDALEKVDFEDVRTIPQIERFLREMEEGEEQQV
jgi:hypothetical protein